MVVVERPLIGVNGLLVPGESPKLQLATRYANAVLKAATKWTVDDMAGFLKGYAKKSPDITKGHREHLSKALAERDKRKRAR